MDNDRLGNNPIANILGEGSSTQSKKEEETKPKEIQTNTPNNSNSVNRDNRQDKQVINKPKKLKPKVESSFKKNYTIYVDANTMENISQIAFIHRRSKSELLENILKKYVASYKNRYGKIELENGNKDFTL